MAKSETTAAVTLTAEQTLQQAITLHRAGNLPKAERLYRTVLASKPQQPTANHNLGMLAVQKRQQSLALHHFKLALEADPRQQQYWLSYIDALLLNGKHDAARQLLLHGRVKGLQGEAVDLLAKRIDTLTSQADAAAVSKSTVPASAEIKLVETLIEQGCYAEAEVLAREITARFPEHGFGWNALGLILSLQRRTLEALELMQNAVAILPGDAAVQSNLGNLFKDLGRLQEAAASYRLGLAINPDFAEAHYNLSIVLKELGCLQDAESSCRRALAILPRYAEALSHLGIILMSTGRLKEAEDSWRQAVTSKPAFADAHDHLGTVLLKTGRLQEAEISYRRALSINPDFAGAHSNMGNLLKDMGRLEESEASFRRALAISPDFFEAHSNLLFTMNYAANHDQLTQFAEACKYGQMVGKKAGQPFSAWQCNPQPERLRIGMVSGDLRNHPVGYFLENVLAQLDKQRVELIAYPTSAAADDLTARIRPCFSAWKPLTGLNDEAAARLIHSDGVHLLLDLSGHSAGNRLPLFVWKPAPVQVSWLGYPGTTGVAQIDYFFGDPYVNPVCEDHFFSEEIWRLPESYLCFTPPADPVPIAPLPALTAGKITFGSFNNLAKMDNAVVALWSRILHAVPTSRLLLRTVQLGDAAVQAETLRRFALHGIAADRLILDGTFSTRSELFAAYNRIDIALDPFPHAGMTTSAETLWMGVPFITLRGERFPSRAGESIARNSGLADWVANDHDDYVTKAVYHAADLPRLAALRAGLRRQVLASPLFDAPRFARHLEDALWGMWERGLLR